MTRFLMFLSIVSVQVAFANTTPIRGSVDTRVREIAYNRDDVIRLHGFVGYHIDFEFAPGEKVVNVAGNMTGLDIGVEQNHLMLKPKARKVRTNVTVITGDRVYHFDYSAVRKIPDPRIDDVIYSLRFTYPSNDAAAHSRSEANAALDRPVVPRNTDYWFCGPSTLRPASAFDDGMQTHLTFPATAEFPAIFVAAEEGGESLVNFTVDAKEVIVHRIAKKLILRRGTQVGCIENRSFTGGGEHSVNGTVSDAVTRETVGAKP
jgi:type IV secretion system protein VirB9